MKPRLVRYVDGWLCARFVRWPSGMFATSDVVGEGATANLAYWRWRRSNDT